MKSFEGRKTWPDARSRFEPRGRREQVKDVAGGAVDPVCYIPYLCYYVYHITYLLICMASWMFPSPAQALAGIALSLGLQADRP